jgi:hypothetical protein
MTGVTKLKDSIARGVVDRCKYGSSEWLPSPATLCHQTDHSRRLSLNVVLGYIIATCVHVIERRNNSSHRKPEKN